MFYILNEIFYRLSDLNEMFSKKKKKENIIL